MNDTDDQDLTIKVLRARCAELEQKLQVVAHERAVALAEVDKLRAQIQEIYDAQNG